MLDRKTQAAVERELQIITEAAYRLAEHAPILCPEIDWRKVRGMGNILRHGYHALDADILWSPVQSDVPHLSSCAESALNRLAADSTDRAS